VPAKERGDGGRRKAREREEGGKKKFIQRKEERKTTNYTFVTDNFALKLRIAPLAD